MCAARTTLVTDTPAIWVVALEITVAKKHRQEGSKLQVSHLYFGVSVELIVNQDKDHS